MSEFYVTAPVANIAPGQAKPKLTKNDLQILLHVTVKGCITVVLPLDYSPDQRHGTRKAQAAVKLERLGYLQAKRPPEFIRNTALNEALADWQFTLSDLGRVCVERLKSMGAIKC